MKVVLQRPDGLFWVNYAKVRITDPETKWGTIDKALIEEVGGTGVFPGKITKVDSHIGTWRVYPLVEPSHEMAPPVFTLEELEEAKRMIEGT